ncbi:hypothetical protein L484_011937 [Morus notabilis]|uniref:Endoplasmic reticulum transmembrane protein n=1 Tax=Morus notabilis TaxID=981085 RepID=W9QI22_9ROSA|nr:hypothetical protein L484_011937 [Morus notabilis]
MIELLYMVIAVEMVLILTLIFKTPLRQLVLMALDKVKRGRGPVMVKTIAITVFLLFVVSVCSFVNIQNHITEAGGGINPTDQVLMAKHLLEASLMGFQLEIIMNFPNLYVEGSHLGFASITAIMKDYAIIASVYKNYRLHHYIRELRILRKTMEAAKKQNRGHENGKNGNAAELKASEQDIAQLKATIKKLESECKTKTEEAEAAEGKAEALKKQSEGFLMEYDHLLAENQNLRNQLESIDQSLLASDNKKSI